MLTDRLRIVFAVALLLYFFVLFRMLKKGKLELKYSLLWLLTGVVLSVLDAFPALLDSMCDVIGVASAVNGLFVALIGWAFLLLLSLTAIASRQKERIKELAQNEALLEERIRKLEKELENE